jgi:predicted nucleic acid-binding protein
MNNATKQQPPLPTKIGYIVSGDKHLPDLKSYRGIQIMKGADFLEIFE